MYIYIEHGFGTYIRFLEVSMGNKCYMIIDLKSFYASVECIARDLDPMTAKLVVADPDRSKGTICLAITPAMKALGIRNRCRIFEIPKGIDYIIAKPRMKKYIDVSANIYEIYLQYFSKDDIHVYSIDESFMDVSAYLKLYNISAHDLALKLMGEIQQKEGLRATCGIGPNLYLAKVALDILAKHSPDYIAELDEETYKAKLWNHRPLTDFWRIGPGTVRRLSTLGILTQRDIAMAPQDVLYKAFGSNAEYLIDHAWGREPCTIDDIKHYENKSHSLSCGQVLMKDYTYDEALIVVKEMANELSLEMVEKRVVSSTFSLYVGYSKDAFPPAGGSVTLQVTTNSVRLITDAMTQIYKQTVVPGGLIRRLNMAALSILDECYEQYSFFVDPTIMEKDRHLSRSVNNIKDKFGKNAIFKGMDLLDAATQLERNAQIGGHAAGEEL